MVFMSTCFLLSEYSTIQLAITLLVSTLMISYLVECWPFEENFYTKIELMNEMTAAIMTYVMFTFTDWVESAEMRYSLGWPFIGLLCLNLIVHIFFLLKDIL